MSLLREKATFAAGCFWGVEYKFSHLKGVLGTKVGYIGGKVQNPDYKSVCAGITEHAEAVEVDYDPTVVSYKQLVEFFFSIHDPTTLNRQGPDVGTQYRSAIFYRNQEQLSTASAVKTHLEVNKAFESEIVTQLVESQEFFPAEEYHQKYLEKKGATSCAL